VSERALIRAREWLQHAHGEDPCQVSGSDDAECLAALLLRFAAQARLDEARWWHNFAFIHPWTGRHVKDAYARTCCKRLEALESQAGGARTGGA